MTTYIIVYAYVPDGKIEGIHYATKTGPSRKQVKAQFNNHNKPYNYKVLAVMTIEKFTEALK